MSARRRAGAGLAAAAAAAVLLLTAACGGKTSAGAGSGSSKSEDKGPLVVASWGSTTTESMRKYLAEPFTKETGIEIKIVDAPGKYAAGVQSQSRAGKIQWDILDAASAPDAYALHAQGLLEPLPADLKQKLSKILVDGAVKDFGYSYSALGYIVGCQEQRVASCPDAQQYFDAKAYPGRRQMIATSPMVNLSLAELANGVAPKDLGTHEINMDRAFAKLKELKPDVKVWWQSSDQSQQTIRNGEVDLGILYSGRIYLLKEQGTPVKPVWKGGLYNPGYMAVVKGSQHKDAAFRFLQWIAEHPEAQAGWASGTRNSVPNPKSFDTMTPQLRESLADWPANREVLANINYDWYVKNLDEVNRRWQEFLRG
ncbi:extracellular solute-binding protein [Planosporangium flavigriseum]|nr:extracellular solute-binding protein [Planosporangium flavigriseum]NJC67722.1 extracellular solute-binding protein [Planosporangium flavigriseum]